MSRFFIGELSETGLVELIKPLIDRKNSGMVLIRGKQAGEIFLEGGNIVHAKTPLASGEEAFLAMMGWETGRITFDTDALIPDRTILMPFDQLLVNWSYRKDEWERIREVIPNRNTIYRISMQKNPGDMNISAEQWNVLAMSNGTKKVSDIAEALGWDEFKTSKVIYTLIHEGLLEKTTGEPLAEQQFTQPVAQKRFVNGNFFPSLENELKKIMGPIASFIIEDKLTEFGEARDSFPQDQAQAFVESLSEEITNNLKKKDFIKKIMDSLSLAESRNKI